MIVLCPLFRARISLPSHPPGSKLQWFRNWNTKFVENLGGCLLIGGNEFFVDNGEGSDPVLCEVMVPSRLVCFDEMHQSINARKVKVQFSCQWGSLIGHSPAICLDRSLKGDGLSYFVSAGHPEIVQIGKDR